jgi:hypothetical protein
MYQGLNFILALPALRLIAPEEFLGSNACVWEGAV